MRYWLGNLSHRVLTVLGRSTRLLDTVEDVMGGEVDELEEDVGRSISIFEGAIDVEEGKLEEELVDKPGTTIGTLHCIRIPFLMRCGF